MRVFVSILAAVVLVVAAAPAPAAAQVRSWELLAGAAWENGSFSPPRDFITAACRDLTPGVGWTSAAPSKVKIDLKVFLARGDTTNPWFNSGVGRGGTTQECDLRKGYDTVSWEMPGPVDWANFPDHYIVVRAKPSRNTGFLAVNAANQWGSLIFGTGRYPGTQSPAAAAAAANLALDPDELGR